ncbi:MAG: ThuA domain-containing protein [Thermodesulfobacteriota bacterium]|nr:ThuA domain-containing protein [Thermodesulfobacteriota bacterium]
MVKNILIVSSGIIHPSVLVRTLFHNFLKQIDGYQYSFSTSIETLKRLKREKYDSVVIYLHRKKISGDALDALDEFIDSGGGLLAIHSASASFKKHDRYFGILGGRFISHGKIGEIKIVQSNECTKIFGDIGNFSVRDELYMHEWDKNNNICFFTEKNNKIEPMVWTRGYGAGRVCYIAVGHCYKTMKNPDVQEIISRGLSWVSGNK